MKFEARYNLGDIVYTVQKSILYSECPMCEGEGRVMAQVKEEPFRVTCPKCKGYKKVAQSEEGVWNILDKVFVGIGLASPIVEAKFEIKQIIVTEGGISYKVAVCNPDSNLSRFTIDRLSRVISEEKVFGSREEAQAFCDKMNELEGYLKGEM